MLWILLPLFGIPKIDWHRETNSVHNLIHTYGHVLAAPTTEMRTIWNEREPHTKAKWRKLKRGIGDKRTTLIKLSVWRSALDLWRTNLNSHCTLLIANERQTLLLQFKIYAQQMRSISLVRALSLTVDCIFPHREVKAKIVAFLLPFFIVKSNECFYICTSFSLLFCLKASL